MIAFRATVKSHDVAFPRVGSKRPAERHRLAKVSCVASSARPLSPILRSAIPSTGLAYRRWSSSNARWSPWATRPISSASVRESALTSEMLATLGARGKSSRTGIAASMTGIRAARAEPDSASRYPDRAVSSFAATASQLTTFHQAAR